MTYSSYIYKAKELTIQQLDNGTWYLEPEWQDILYREGMGELDNLEDSYLDGWYTLEDILKLEVDRRNAKDSKKNEVINWLYDLITVAVEPAVLQEENEFIKNMMDYMKVNHELNTGDMDGDVPENVIPIQTKS